MPFERRRTLFQGEGQTLRASPFRRPPPLPRACRKAEVLVARRRLPTWTLDSAEKHPAFERFGPCTQVTPYDSRLVLHTLIAYPQLLLGYVKLSSNHVIFITLYCISILYYALQTRQTVRPPSTQSLDLGKLCSILEHFGFANST